jgi:hypothetical protein
MHPWLMALTICATLFGAAGAVFKHYAHPSVASIGSGQFHGHERYHRRACIRAQ